jgi:hypothetical protein
MRMSAQMLIYTNIKIHLHSNRAIPLNQYSMEKEMLLALLILIKYMQQMIILHITKEFS